MKNMTKRDIADIVLVWVGLTCILDFLGSLAGLGAMLFMPESQFPSKSASIPFQMLYVLVVIVCAWFLLFRREIILDLLFPHAAQEALELSAEAQVLTNYAFWIRLVGIVTSLSSGVRFFSRLATALAAGGEHTVDAFWWNQSGPELVGTILAVIIIWKTDQIAQVFERIGSSNKKMQQTQNHAE